MKWFLAGVAALHLVFAFFEMYPWSFPILLRKVSESRLQGYRWTVTERSNAATEERLKSGHAVGGLSIV